MSETDSNVRPNQVYTLVETYSLFELDNRARRLSPRTIEHHAFYLGRFFSWCADQQVTHLHQVTPVHLRAFLVHLQEQDWSDWSIHGAARDIRRSFGSAWEIISRDRANDYAEGATRGALDAIQVADRFYLLQNVREVLERLLARHQAASSEHS